MASNSVKPMSSKQSGLDAYTKDISSLMKDNATTIRIWFKSASGSHTAIGLQMDDISFGGSNTWRTGQVGMKAVNSLVNGMSNISSLVDTAAKSAITNGGTDNMAANLSSTTLSDVQYGGSYTSQARYESSAKPEVSIKMFVPMLKDTDDLIAQLTPLYDLVEPDGAGSQTLKYSAPLGYKTTVAGVNNTTNLRVYIGVWLIAKGVVCDNVDISFSKALGKNHKPLFATVSMKVVSATVQKHSAWLI